MIRIWIVYDAATGAVRSAWRRLPSAGVASPGEAVAEMLVQAAMLSHVVGMRFVGGRLVDPRLVGA